MTAAAYQNGQWRCYSLPDGRHKHFLGCAHERPRQAIAHVTPSYVSPLRPSGVASTPLPSAPQPGTGLLDATPDSLRGASPVQDTGQ